MSLDESRLTPAPWEWFNKGCYYQLEGPQSAVVLDDGSAADEYSRAIEPDSADALFIAIARNFLDCCYRRGWGFRKGHFDGWVIVDSDDRRVEPLAGVMSILAAWQAAVDLDRKLTEEQK